MKLTDKLISIYKISTSDKRLFFEAVFTSAYVRFTLSFLPFKKVVAWLGQPNKTNTNAAYSSAETIRRVQQAVRRCNKYTAWKTECYTQALTGKILLRRRNIASTLYIGFMKDEQEQTKYKGHAWLKVNDLFVTGYDPQLQQFQIHSFFS